VANFGITITNVVLSGLSELVCRLTRQPWRKAILGTAGFGAAVAVIGVVLAVLSLAVWPSDQIHSSSRAVKQVYWDAASAERTRERQSPRPGRLGLRSGVLRDPAAGALSLGPAHQPLSL